MPKIIECKIIVVLFNDTRALFIDKVSKIITALKML